jgi:hypothetical protein
MSVEIADTMPVDTQSKPLKAIIKHSIALCGFPDASSMAEIMDGTNGCHLLCWMMLTI